MSDDVSDAKRPCVKPSGPECVQSRSDMPNIQRISSGSATQAEALKHRSSFPPEYSSLASSACMSPAHSGGPLSPSSTATLAAVPPFSHDSSCIQPAVPVHASASCASVDTDHVHQARCKAVTNDSKVCQGDQPLHGVFGATTDAICEPAQQQQQQPVHREQRPGEATSEPRIRQRKRPRVRNRATAVRPPRLPALYTLVSCCTSCFAL